MTYIPILPVDDLPDGERVVVEVDGQEVLILHVGEAFFAISNVCSHEYQQLEKGRLEGHVLYCPKHGASFDIRNGYALSLPAMSAINIYATRIEAGMVEILI